MALPRAKFFQSINDQGLALTFDDVRLDTGRSHVAAADTKLKSKFSRNIELNVPIVSAAMDTVTTAAMAIEMAKLGGLGVIHAGLSPDEQRKEVYKVKFELNGKIDVPITVSQNDTLGDVLAMCMRRDFDFRTFPVVNKTGRLIGLITQNDFDFNPNPKTVVKDIMTPAKDVVTGSATTSIKRAYKLMRDAKKKTLPLVSKSGKLKGLYIFTDVSRIVNDESSTHNVDINGSLRVGAAVPTDEGALDRIELMKKYVDVIVIDTAQGDSDYAFKTLKQIKKRYPKIDVVVGNVSNPDSAKLLAQAGADGIKVGQGPGSICTTRIETGIGSPQVSAVYECAKAVKKYNVPVCADGGITNPGDISIAIAAGASSVMMGSKLAGTKEAPGKVITTEDNKLVKLYRGMGSPSALKESEASRKRYGVDASKGTPLSEGIESYVPYKGEVADIMDHYIKALRKSMSYVGSKDIETHRTKTRFLRITNAGMKESMPHDVAVITK